MAVPRFIRDVFDHFQNLNLLALRDDLWLGRTPRNAWLAGSWLCPVAHGLPASTEVSRLHQMGQAGEPGFDCVYAARQLGARPEAVRWFVARWDAGEFSGDWLADQLEELWQERLADAELMQMLLPPVVGEVEGTGASAAAAERLLASV